MSNKIINLGITTKAVIEFSPPPLPIIVPSEQSHNSFEIELNYEGTEQDFREWAKNSARLAQAKAIDDSYAKYVKEEINRLGEDDEQKV